MPKTFQKTGIPRRRGSGWTTNLNTPSSMRIILKILIFLTIVKCVLQESIFAFKQAAIKKPDSCRYRLLYFRVDLKAKRFQPFLKTQNHA